MISSNFLKIFVIFNVISFSQLAEMEKCKVLITAHNVPQVAINLLQEYCELIINDEKPYATKEQIAAKAKGVDAILWSSKHFLDSTILDAAGSNLKVIGAMSAGVDNIDIPELKKRGIKLSNTPEVLNESVAEIAILLAIAAARRLQEGRNDIENGNWKSTINYLLGQDVYLSTVGIVGLGNIGLTVAKKFQALGASKILYSGHRIKDEGTEIGAKFVTFNELLKKSDFVIVTCPLNNETRHMFNDNAFAQMKNTSVFVNVARGEIVDQPALVRALQNKTIFGAGLDVMTPEPLPKDDILLSLPNCVLLPHLGSATVKTRNAMAELAAQNILRGIGGAPMFTPVLP